MGKIYTIEMKISIHSLRKLVRKELLEQFQLSALEPDSATSVEITLQKSNCDCGVCPACNGKIGTKNSDDAVVKAANAKITALKGK